MPSAGGMSSGLGRKSTTASSMGWTPLFLKAEPQRIGTKSNASVPLRMAALMAVFGDLLAAEVGVHQRLVLRGDGLHHRFAVLVGLVDHVLGDVLDLVGGAEVLLVDVAPHERLHPHDVDEALEGLDGLGATGADRQLDDQRVGLQTVDDHLRRCGRSRRRCGPSC